MKKPLLVLVEGISGSGKGRQVDFTAEYLTTRGYNASIVREPTDFLKDVILAYKKLPASQRLADVETMLFTADRMQHTHTTLANLLSNPNAAVVSDRSYISTCVYQSMQGMSLEKIIEMNSFYPKPDLVLVLQCDPEEALRRIQERAKKEGKEVSPDEELRKIQSLKNGYELIAQRMADINFKSVYTGGRVEASHYQIRSHLNNLLGIPMSKAVFLDKDGTLVDNSGYPDKIPSDEIYYERTVEGLRKLQDDGYKLIIMSSQPWVARGRLTLEQTEDIFKSVVAKYAAQGIRIDDYYYCLHQRGDGCECKKPNTALLEKASEKFNLDTSASFFVGDQKDDIGAGRNFGLRTCLVRTGVGSRYESRLAPDMTVQDVNEFAKAISKERLK